MEFEEMQVIWDSQNNEKLYAINEEVLHKKIRKKSESAERKVDRFELLLIIVNLITATILTVDTLIDGDQLAKLLIPAIYGTFGIIGLVRRLRRQREVLRFDETVVGEVDKAIWQISYLIEQSKMVITWYLPTIIGLLLLLDFLEGGFFDWGAVFMLVAFIIGYFGGRWEINRCYIPRKQELESLRATLLTTPED